MARRRLDHTIGLVGCLLAVLIAAAPVSAQQATCQKSRFGADDQVGNLNYVTPEKTLAATKLVTRGRPTGSVSRPTRTRRPTRRAPSP